MKRVQYVGVAVVLAAGERPVQQHERLVGQRRTEKTANGDSPGGDGTGENGPSESPVGETEMVSWSIDLARTPQQAASR